jgi:hypothetical protein
MGRNVGDRVIAMIYGATTDADLLTANSLEYPHFSYAVTAAGADNSRVICYMSRTQDGALHYLAKLLPQADGRMYRRTDAEISEPHGPSCRLQSSEWSYCDCGLASRRAESARWEQIQ